MLFSVVGLAFVSGVIAQTVPSSVQPGVSDKPAKPVGEGKSSDKVIIPAPSRQITPELAKSVEFTLVRLEISGNSTISSETFAPFYQDLIGQKIKLARIFGVANEITKAYAAAGYALSLAYVPAQEIGEDGAVRIRVTEGYVAELSFSEGSEALNPRQLRQLEVLKAERPLTVAALER